MEAGRQSRPPLFVLLSQLRHFPGVSVVQYAAEKIGCDRRYNWLYDTAAHRVLRWFFRSLRGVIRGPDRQRRRRCFVHWPEISVAAGADCSEDLLSPDALRKVTA